MASRRAARTKLFQRRKGAERQRLGTLEVPILAEDAPIGSYRIDDIADELLNLGATPSDRIEFVRLLREKIYIAAQMALISHRNYYVREPRIFQKVKRLFDDIARIAILIQRNKDLNRTEIIIATKRTNISVPDVEYISKRLEDLLSAEEWGKKPLDETSELFAALERAAIAIKNFEGSRKPEKKGGNHDPLTEWFMQEVYEVWCNLLRIDRNAEENKLFLRLLCAAWRDVQFPTKEAGGQLLEEWLSDRVRKKFHGGVCDCRIERQQQMYQVALDQGVLNESNC